MAVASIDKRDRIWKDFMVALRFGVYCVIAVGEHRRAGWTPALF